MNVLVWLQDAAVSNVCGIARRPMAKTSHCAAAASGGSSRGAARPPQGILTPHGYGDTPLWGHCSWGGGDGVDCE